VSENAASHIGPRQLDAVLGFLPTFESPGYQFGEWNGAGYFSYSSEVNDFIKTLYAQDVIISFDWTSWRREAQRYQTDPRTLETADLLTLCKLLTLHVRADRFSEGHLANVLESGHITAVLRRLKQIRDQMP
jgi:hypothetical protein